MIKSYPSVFNKNHNEFDNLYGKEVVIQEKIDGSQFSFGVFDGELKCRSKNKEQYPVTDTLFYKAVETVKQIQHLLIDGYTYRCEYLQKPKHNTLTYESVPIGNLIGYDVMGKSDEQYLVHARDLFESIGLGVVPTYFYGALLPDHDLDQYLQRESILGGKVEGVVIKAYGHYGRDKKTLMAKHVRPEFHELNQDNWKVDTNKDLVTNLIVSYRTDARWNKAVQHVREDGLLKGEMQDLRHLIPEVWKDILKEHEGDIKQTLFDHFKKELEKGVTKGLPEWYKSKLAATDEGA